MTVIIEYIDHMDAYRIYDAEQPQQTMAYSDTIAEAIDGIREKDSDARIIIYPGDRPLKMDNLIELSKLLK